MNQPLALEAFSSCSSLLLTCSVHSLLISCNSFPCTFICTTQFKHRGILGARSLRSGAGGIYPTPLERPPPPAVAAHKLCGFFVLAWQSSTAVKPAQPCELADGMDGLRLALAFALFILFASGWALCPLWKADHFKIQPLSNTWLHHRSWKVRWH